MHLYWVVALNSKSICVNRFQLCFRNRRHLITAETQSDDRIPIWRIHLSKLFDTFVTFENETRKTLLRLISWGDRGAAIYFFVSSVLQFLFLQMNIPRSYHFKDRSFVKSLHHDHISKWLIMILSKYFVVVPNKSYTFEIHKIFIYESQRYEGDKDNKWTNCTLCVSA